MRTLRISELAAQSGVPSTTLRYYEHVGLLPAARTPAGYRVYDDEAVQRLRFISAAKRLQLSLDSIRALLPTWQQQPCRSVKAQLRPMVSERLADTENAVVALTELAAQLRADLHRLDVLPDRDQGCDPTCAFLDATTPPGSDRCECDTGAATAVCSLSEQEYHERITRWHTLLAGATLTWLSLGVSASLPLDAAADVVDLITAEQQCCPFLGFQLDFHTRAVTLSISAADESALPFAHALVAGTAE